MMVHSSATRTVRVNMDAPVGETVSSTQASANLCSSRNPLTAMHKYAAWSQPDAQRRGNLTSSQLKSMFSKKTNTLRARAVVFSKLLQALVAFHHHVADILRLTKRKSDKTVNITLKLKMCYLTPEICFIPVISQKATCYNGSKNRAVSAVFLHTF